MRQWQAMWCQWRRATMTKDMVHLAVLTAIGGSLLVAIGLL
jgi:hypothetical protein